MSVRSFLSKLLYGSSTIHRAFVVRDGLDYDVSDFLRDPSLHGSFDELLSLRVVSFRVSCVDLFIFVH